MTGRTPKQTNEVIEWSTIADLRHISTPEMRTLEHIQGELDFSQTQFALRHAANPTRAVIRADKEAELLDAWEGDSGVLLRAPWRSGKTELVFALVDNRNLHDRFLFINSQDGPYRALQWRSADDFRQIYGAREVVNHVSGLPSRTDGPLSRDDVSKALDRHISAGGSAFSFLSAERRDRGLPPALVALDEIADYAFDREQLGFLESIVHESHVRLCLIVQKAPSRESSYAEAFPEFRSVYLKPLTVNETAQIVRAKTADEAVTFTLHGIVELHRAAGGRPMEVAALVDLCRQATQEGRHGPSYTRADIDKLVKNEIIYLTNSKVMEELITNHIRVFEASLTPAEKALTEELCKAPHGAAATDENAAVVENLVRHGLAARNRDRVFINGLLYQEAVLHRMDIWRAQNYWVRDEYGLDYPA